MMFWLPKINLNKEDEIKVKLEKLEIEDGDILYVKFQSTASLKIDEYLKKIRDLLKTIGRDKILLLVANSDQDISTLKSKDMEKAGWYRKEKIREIFYDIFHKSKSLDDLI